MEILTYLHRDGKFKGGDKHQDPETRGLILGQFPIYDGNWTIISRLDRENFQGPISDVFCVREVRTKNPVLLKANSNHESEKDEEDSTLFPLDYINENLVNLHRSLLEKRFKGIMALPDSSTIKVGPRYDNSVIYQAYNSDNGLEIGIDPLDRKKPGVVNKFKGIDLEARLIIKSWSRGNSPTARYMGTEETYTTENIMTMLNDTRFKGQMLPQIADQTLKDALSNLPKTVLTEELGRYVVLLGGR